MLIVRNSIDLKDLKQMSIASYGNLVKAVVDIERDLLALDSELHSDLEYFLIEDGSKQSDLWGINLYPELPESEFIEFDSLINIRPWQGNRRREVEDPIIREKIVQTVTRKIRR